MKKGKPKQNQSTQVRINESIRAIELRIIDDEKGNLGVMSSDEALRLAREAGMDLIEISPEATPPIAKIMDYGKFQYMQKKKDNQVRSKARAAMVEVKEIQIKPGTGENDLLMKAKRTSQWLIEGHRIKVEIFLRGREKFMNKTFHESRITQFLTHITEPYTIVDNLKVAPKGLSLIIERDRKAKKDDLPVVPVITLPDIPVDFYEKLELSEEESEDIPEIT